MEKIKTIFNNIKLCIKYPFLYPRNRFTGTHWYWYEMRELYLRYKRDACTWECTYENNISRKINDYPKYIVGCILEWIHNYPLQLFHCIPTYTELDAMPDGWRKAFGLQMCEEIKQALLKNGYKALYRYRIVDIKEKWGYLHWYDSWTTIEVQNIITKYEKISYHTCIECGKPAKYLTRSWICPYCEDCIEDKSKADLISE